MALIASKSKWRFGIPGFGKSQIPVTVRCHRDTCAVALHFEGVIEKANGAEIASESVEDQIRNSSELQNFHQLSAQFEQAKKDSDYCRVELEKAKERLEVAVVNNEDHLEDFENDVANCESRLNRFNQRRSILEQNVRDAQGRLRDLAHKLLQEECDVERRSLEQQSREAEDAILSVIGEHLTRLAEIRQREAHVRLSSGQRNNLVKQMIERLTGQPED